MSENPCSQEILHWSNLETLEGGVVNWRPPILKWPVPRGVDFSKQIWQCTARPCLGWRFGFRVRVRVRVGCRVCGGLGLGVKGAG
jgi:hypothetical protein